MLDNTLIRVLKLARESQEGRRFVREELSLVLYSSSVREPDSRIRATHSGARHTINKRVAGTRGNSHTQSPDPRTTSGARTGKRHAQGQGGPCFRSGEGWVLPQIGRRKLPVAGTWLPSGGWTLLRR